MGIHRPQRSPSQRFRFEQFQQFLEKHNFKVDYFYLINAWDDLRFYSNGHYVAKSWILLKSIWALFWVSIRAKTYDVVFVQREANMLGTVFFETWIAKKTKMIYDFDDSIWLQNVSDANRSLAFLKDPNKTAKLIGIADLVLAGNHYLNDYASKYSSTSIYFPTVVDTDVYVPHIYEDKPVCIGWSGSFSTVPYFKMIVPVLEKLKQKYGDAITFSLIGDSSYSNDTLGLKGQDWSADREIEMLSHLDIGLMPLPDDEWTKGKCGLKALLYMSMGIPAVVSDVGVNSEVVEDNVTGYLCRSTDDWFERLSILIENQSKRVEMGKRGRDTVIHKYSVSVWQNILLQEIQSLTG